MTGTKDHYTLLGIPRNASPDQVRRAYRQAALRLHPDRNPSSEDNELFLRVSQAYETLIDEAKRAEYDELLIEQEAEQAAKAALGFSVMHSRKSLLQLDEPQVHYLLIDVFAKKDLEHVRAPVNLSIVIDRSTSMRGARMDQLRSATQQILQSLEPGDTASVVAFSDRAEVIVSPDQAADLATARARLSLLQADGGTEIGQGLRVGIQELQRNYTRDGINHLILLTDGRTYGDEDDCLAMASSVASRGVTINGVGIGSDWSDRFLDDLTGRTGGGVMFLDTPKAVHGLMESIFDSLGKIVAARVLMDGGLSQHIDLRSAYRLLPEPTVLGDALPLLLGNLPRDGKIQVLLEVVVHPIGEMESLPLANLSISADILGEAAKEESLPVEIDISVSEHPDTDPPPKELVDALGAVSLYRMQDKARHEAELGQTNLAARRLENLATQLLANGQRELAKTALSEAEHLTRSRRISNEGEKVLKYGTRALLLPARTGNGPS